MKSYAEFKAAIRARESSGKYECVNKLGYLGAYQFGLARLCDLGVTRRKDPASKGFSNSLFEFIPPMSQALFLGSQGIQDAIFDAHVMRLKEQCEKIAPENLSGAIAACHLLGIGGLLKFVRYKIDEADAFGTKLSMYFEQFKGYRIP